MIDLTHVLKKRLKAIHHHYLLPGGNRDDKIQELGRIMELNFIIKLLAANKIAPEIKKITESSSCIKLTITQFDDLENTVAQAERIEEELIFIGDAENNAFCKCQNYIHELNYKLYLGWNDEVYPKFKVERVYPR